METKYLRMIQGMKGKGGRDWTVYILRCGDGSLYTGIAKDVRAGFRQHGAGRGDLHPNPITRRALISARRLNALRSTYPRSTDKSPASVQKRRDHFRWTGDLTSMNSVGVPPHEFHARVRLLIRSGLIREKEDSMKKTMSGLVALLLILCTGISAHAQGIEWETLNDEVMSLYRQGRYDRAVVVAKKALQVAEQAVGPDHPAVATSLNNLAVLYGTQGQYAQAEPLYKRSLAIREKALGPDHPDVATSLNNLAVLYRAQGQYAQAEPLYKRSLAIREKALGPDHPDVATSLNNLAELYRRPRPVRAGRAALQALAGDQGEGPRPGSSRCGHEPEQPRGAVPTPKASTRRPSRSTSARWRSGRRPSARIIPMWPRALRIWPSSIGKPAGES